MFRCTLLSLLALTLPLHAGQAGIVSSWRTGLVVGSDLSSSGVLASWNNSVGGFVEATRKVSSLVQIAPRLTVRYVWFDTYRGSPLVSIPEISWAAAGEDLREIEARVAVCISGSRPVRPFLGIAGGLLVADVGKVTFTGTNMSDPSKRLIVTAEGTNKIVTKALFGINAGIVFGSRKDGANAGFEGSLMISTDGSYGRFELACFLGFR